MTESSRSEVKGSSPEFVPVERFLKTVDGTPYVDILEQRFGMPREAFERYWIHQANRDNVWIVDRTLQVPEKPAPHSLGFPFFYSKMEYPRPTTAAAVHFGPLATKNIFDLEGDELSRLVYRKGIVFDDSRLEALADNGYVMLRHRSLVVGLGYFRPEEDGGGSVKSLLPRSWTQRLSLNPPDSLVPGPED